MTVYVDELTVYPNAKLAIFRRGSSHMIADSSQELAAMARRIGLLPSWLQDRDTYREHYDLTPMKRLAAVHHGAIELTLRELAIMLRARYNQQKDTQQSYES